MGDNTKTAELCRMDPASSAALYGRSICGSIGLPAWAQRLCDAWCTPSVVVVVALAAVVLVMAATACRLDDAKVRDRIIVMMLVLQVSSRCLVRVGYCVGRFDFQWRRAASGGSASGDGGGIGAKLPGAMPRVPARIRLPWTMCRITSPPLAAVYRIPFWWGPSRVVVTDPRLVADVVRHQRVLQRRSDFGMHWLLDAMLGQSLVAKDGDDWHRVLAAFRRPFAPGHVRANMSHAVHIVEAWAGGLLPDADGESVSLWCYVAITPMSLPCLCVRVWRRQPDNFGLRLGGSTLPCSGCGHVRQRIDATTGAAAEVVLARNGCDHQCHVHKQVGGDPGVQQAFDTPSCQGGPVPT